MVFLEKIEDEVASRFAKSGKNYIELTLKATGETIGIKAYGFNKRASQKTYSITSCEKTIKQGMKLYEVAEWLRDAN